MSVTLSAKYSKQDLYNNPVFSVLKSDGDSYNILSTINRTIKRMKTDTFMPVYVNDDDGYATVRFKRSRNEEFVQGSTYKLTFDVNKRNHENKIYISCYLVEFSLETAVDLGETIDFKF